jgi:hypothetical protein
MAAWMNADDMERHLVLARFIVPTIQVKRARPTQARQCEGAAINPCKSGTSSHCDRLELLNLAGLPSRQAELLLVLLNTAHDQAFGLQNCERQHHNRCGLMRQREVDRHLTQQR